MSPLVPSVTTLRQAAWLCNFTTEMYCELACTNVLELGGQAPERWLHISLSFLERRQTVQSPSIEYNRVSVQPNWPGTESLSALDKELLGLCMCNVIITSCRSFWLQQNQVEGWKALLHPDQEMAHRLLRWLAEG